MYIHMFIYIFYFSQNIRYAVSNGCCHRLLVLGPAKMAVGPGFGGEGGDDWKKTKTGMNGASQHYRARV